MRRSFNDLTNNKTTFFRNKQGSLKTEINLKCCKRWNAGKANRITKGVEEGGREEGRGSNPAFRKIFFDTRCFWNYAFHFKKISRSASRMLGYQKWAAYCHQTSLLYTKFLCYFKLKLSSSVRKNIKGELYEEIYSEKKI